MPLEASLAHRVFSSTNLPYVSKNSPTDTDPFFGPGSSDILTSISGYAQRRPGFANNVETTPVPFISLKRIFTWDRFDGSFYIMACDVNTGDFALVYKLQVGVDSSFSLIYNEPTPTGTAYDFVVSNNTLYFSNGFYVRKWDPLNGLSNWGIAPYVAGTGSLSAYGGTGANVAVGSGATWNNPTNAQGPPDAVYATSDPIDVNSATYYTAYLSLTAYGFTVPATTTITGIQVSVTGHYDVQTGSPPPGQTLNCQLLQNGNPVGSPITLFMTTSDTTMVFGGPSILWDTSWSSAIINGSTFGVYIWGTIGGNPGDSITVSVDAAQITIYGSGSLIVTVSGSFGTMSAVTGYQYVICYGNSNTGHISSPCPPSNNTGAFANKLNVSIPVVVSTDPQVNQIRIFRTTDSATGLGGQSYFEIPAQIPYANGTILDNATDLQLNIYSIAPIPTFNDPPPPMQGMVYFSGRIWGFTGNKVWFTGLEEITVGVPEESVPSGTQGNFWSFDEPVQGLGIAGTGANQILGVFCGGRIYGINGNTLDTFRRFLISNRRGSRNLNCISMMGGMCAWLDSSNQIWATDGSSLQELSIDIRPDIANVVQSQCCLTFHAAGNFHWLVFSTGEKLFVYDIDLEQWMPPWTFPCGYIYSGEISPGDYTLMATKAVTALKLNPNAHNDNGVTYQPEIVTNLMSVVPDFGKRFSYVGQGMYDEPSRTGVPWFVQIDTNNITLADVMYEVDDDPSKATFITIAANKQSADMVWNRSASGVNIIQQIYPVNGPSSRWLSLKIKMANADQNDKIYSYFLAYKSLGGK